MTTNIAVKIKSSARSILGMLGFAFGFGQEFCRFLVFAFCVVALAFFALTALHNQDWSAFWNNDSRFIILLAFITFPTRPNQ